MKKKKVLIINTGGTISCMNTDQGYQPIPGGVARAFASIPNLKHDEMPDYLIKEYQPLLDSSNITPVEWNQIASDIQTHYDEINGVVIFHGTDTMAYTASALSFMLQNLGKPVILTGSQIPLSEVRNDALDNVMTSLWLAAHAKIHEVCIYFNQRLLRGNRAQKISSARFDAFDSLNFPDLAEIGTNITLHSDILLPKPQEAFSIQFIAPQMLANFRLFPGFSLSLLQSILETPALKALILETYGAGNAPNLNPAFLNTLQQACEREILIVNCSQCPHGSVEMDHYETGYTLKQAGLVSGKNMTTEAVHCKLLYLFSKYEKIADVKQKIEENLVGELGIEGY